MNALLEAGGRELLMLTMDDGWWLFRGFYAGASCLMVSAQNGHLEVVNALLEAGGRETRRRLIPCAFSYTCRRVCVKKR